MLSIFAEAATTVVQTVTVTPPNVLVEIVKQPSNGWSVKDFISPVIALFALIVSFLSWRYQGALPRFSAEVYGESISTAIVRVNLINFGRLTAQPGSVEIVGPGGDFWPVTRGDFVPLHLEDEIEQKPLKPGDMFIGDAKLEEIASLMRSPTDTLRSVHFETVVSGKKLKCKVSRRTARKWQAEFSEVIKTHLRNREQVDSELEKMIEDGDQIPLEPIPPLAKEEFPTRLKTWLKTLL